MPRRGSIVPVEERKSSEREVLPKIAFHLEAAGEMVRAVEVYYSAGKLLSNHGVKVASDMFQKCIGLAETLGDDVSKVRLAEYKYDYALDAMGHGRSKEALAVSKEALRSLGEDAAATTFGTVQGLALFWFQQSLCCLGGGRTSTLSKDDELKIKLHVNVIANVAAGHGKRLLGSYSIARAVQLSLSFKPTQDTDTNLLIVLATNYAQLATVLLYVGMRDLAEKAILRSTEMTAFFSLDGHWSLFQFRGGSLFGLGFFDEAKTVLEKAVQQVHDYGPHFYLFNITLLATTLHIQLGEMDVATNLSAMLMEMSVKEELPAREFWSPTVSCAGRSAATGVRTYSCRLNWLCCALLCSAALLSAALRDTALLAAALCDSALPGSAWPGLTQDKTKTNRKIVRTCPSLRFSPRA